MFTFPVCHYGGAFSTIIDSIQQISVTIAGGSASNTATITSVDTSRSIVIWNGFTTNDTSASNVSGSYGADGVNCRIELTNGTTVTAYRANTIGSTITAYGTVIQFAPGTTTGVRKGTISTTTGGSSPTATISAVNTGLSVVFHNGWTFPAATGGVMPATLTLTNSTTVTAGVGSSGGIATFTVGFSVVEFAASVIDSIQQVNTSLTSATQNATITSVDTSRSVVIWNGFSHNNGSGVANIFRYSLSSATNVAYTTGGSGGSPLGAVNYRVTVVQFKTGIIKNIQRGTTSVTGTNNATISTVNPAKTLANWCAITITAANLTGNQFFVGNRINSSTQIQSIINTSPSPDTSTLSWEAVEFN